MIDIETLGNGPQSAILSVAVVPIEPESFPAFYSTVNLQSCLDAGLKIDASTIAWWLKQSDEARGALQLETGPSLATVLDQIDEVPWASITETWAFPPSFDLVILENAYRALGRRPPWYYRTPRCLRTIAAITGVPKPKFVRAPGEASHNALTDAQDQSEWLRLCEAKLAKP